jgi:hypothetical protein
LPDLLAMLRRRSSAGMNPRMAAIIGIFQILWIYYGILIISRPVVVWNVIGVLINFFSVGAYAYFRGKESPNGDLDDSATSSVPNKNRFSEYSCTYCHPTDLGE